MKNFKFTRYIEFGHLFELFFLSAILIILGIRIYLKLTGFPQIGSGAFHIAHLLFGGFFMLASIFGFMTLLNNGLKPYWAILGGIGFGTFIDEIGKFITRDNNYLFQPAFAIIYLIFIALYLFYKSIEHIKIFTEEEYLINSINLLEDLELKHLDKEEKAEVLSYLAKSNQNHFLTRLLIKTFAESGTLPDERISTYEKAKNKLRALYNFFLSRSWFLKTVAFFFIVRSIIYLSTGVFLLDNISKHITDGTITTFLNPGGLLPLIQTFALFFQAILTIAGAVIIAKSRKNAYKFFRDAVLISIFVLQVFNFNRNPIQAFFSTTGDLLLLAILTHMIKLENGPSKNLN